MPRNRSDRRRSSSSVVNKAIEMATRTVATARIVGEICSRRPVNICHGKVFCEADPTNKTTTTSSNDVMKANNAPRLNEFFQGESEDFDDRIEFRDRVLGSVSRIISHHGGERVAIVCHGGVINCFAGDVLGIDVDGPGFFYPNYTSITRIAASRSGVRSIVTINETSHLRNTGLPMGLFQHG